VTVNVVLPLPLDQAYTYRVPEALAGAAQAGARVLVPFRNRRLTGIIVGEGPAAETLDFDVKAVLDVLDDVPVCTEGLLDLTKWIADYYVCPWGEALKAVLPAGTTVETEHRLTRTDAAPDAWADHEVGRTVLETWRPTARRPSRRSASVWGPPCRSPSSAAWPPTMSWRWRRPSPTSGWPPRRKRTSASPPRFSTRTPRTT
jgi:Primosomal protein N'' (replication factor Y) - superfamily II helicase